MQKQTKMDKVTFAIIKILILGIQQFISICKSFIYD